MIVDAARFSETYARIRSEIARIVVGQDELVDGLRDEALLVTETLGGEDGGGVAALEEPGAAAKG